MYTRNTQRLLFTLALLISTGYAIVLRSLLQTEASAQDTLDWLNELGQDLAEISAQRNLVISGKDKLSLDNERLNLLLSDLV